MRNWPQTLRPASYKGAGFFIDEEALAKSGRFVARHSFVKGESHSTEDMGRQPREFRVSAYLASDSADAEVREFVELCSEAGAGALILPMLGPVEARCIGCHVKAKSDKLGYVALELDFVEAGTAEDAFPAAPLGDRLAASDLAELPDVAELHLSGIDEAARAGAVAPPATEYQGSKADQAARDADFARLF
ncbi:MAG TPA: DNA circularization N-terminal domain-containing protein [Reyranella sp.]|nr:DNA circularization N-terminal domain-containing protein [Reyranella sp.]